MKTIIIISLVMMSMMTFGQFPAPQNFEFSFEYFNCNQSGICDGVEVNGPAYCSHFEWIIPDPIILNSYPDYFNIYYYEYYSSDTSIIATTDSTPYEMLIGIIGEVWVTAVYSNPDGESGPSNVVVNLDLPISVEEIINNENLVFFYDQKSQIIRFKDPGQIKQIKIINIQGKVIKLLQQPISNFSLADLTSGLYVVEAMNGNAGVQRLKIVK